MGETRQYTREEGGGLPPRYETVGSDLSVPVVGGRPGGAFRGTGVGRCKGMHPPLPPPHHLAKGSSSAEVSS